MTALEPEQAFIAVNAFLMALWKDGKHGDEVGILGDLGSYTPGMGSFDPAMWSDWLAAAKFVQTGAVLPDPERDSLTSEAVGVLTFEHAYRAMFRYIEEYWERIGRPADLGDLLGQMRYMPGTGTADPEIWKRWLAAIEKVQAGR